MARVRNRRKDVVKLKMKVYRVRESYWVAQPDPWKVHGRLGIFDTWADAITYALGICGLS